MAAPQAPSDWIVIANMLFGIRQWLNPTIKRMPDGRLWMWVIVSPFAGLMLTQAEDSWAAKASGVDDDGDPIPWDTEAFALCDATAPPPEVVRMVMEQCGRAIAQHAKDFDDPWASDQVRGLRDEGWI